MEELIALIELNLTKEELTNVLEIARLALDSKSTRTTIGEWTDLCDSELLSLLHNLTEILY